MRSSVNDGQLGQLAVKSHELFRRAKEGAYEDFDKILIGLQALIEGKDPESPTLVVRPKFAKWRTFHIGGIRKTPLLSRVEMNSKVNRVAKLIMQQKTFVPQEVSEEIETIVLSCKDLCSYDYEYRYAEPKEKMLTSVFLAEWSESNEHRLPEGYTVDLLPAEAGPHIRDQYRDQPEGECFVIAMEPIVVPGRFAGPRRFRVHRFFGERLWLDGSFVAEAFNWFDEEPMVFRLRKTN
jgi:hypothetical protein